MRGGGDTLEAQLADPCGDRVHCLGIGGVGMAGLAALLQHHGFAVDGCDAVENRITDRLRQQGIPVSVGHDVAHLDPRPRLIVRSTAVADGHPECREAQRMGVPVWRRGEVFPALLRNHRTVAISGTHGKTTTTAMCAHVLRGTGMDSGFFIGGEWEAPGRVFHPGDGSVLVVEADESDGTLANYHPEVTVITGIDFDHLEHFRDVEEFEGVFRTVIRQTSGLLIYCGDDSRLRSIVAAHTGPTLAYGVGEHCQWRGVLEKTVPPSPPQVRLLSGGQEIGLFSLPVPGRHNIVNALAALAVASYLGRDMAVAVASLSSFRPVRRRFDRVGEFCGAHVYNDYAHHPTEIRCLIETARSMATGRVIAIFQPHRYTRTRALGAEFPASFAGVDHVVLAPVYAASESPLAGGNLSDLAEHFSRHRAISFRVADDLDTAWNMAAEETREGDMLLLIGAGDIETLAERIEA